MVVTDGYEALRLHRLCALVNQQLSEPEVTQAGITRTHTCAANDVSGLEDFLLSGCAELSVSARILRCQLSQLVLEGLVLTQFCFIRSVKVLHHGV